MMQRVLFGILWLVAFAAMGAGIGAHVPHPHARLAGAMAGLVLWGFAVWWNWLPGVRRRRAMRWGVAQVVWLLLGFIAAQIAGSGLAEYGLPKTGLIGAALTGYLAASLFAFWYIGRLGGSRIRDGSVTGIGWRAAPKRAYFMAAGFALLIIISVIVMVHLVPPDLAKLKNLPNAKLFEQPGASALLLLILAVFIAPPVEELIFRGGIFAALASRVSPFWAGMIATLLFMAVHAPEKIYYLPGFIDVGLMAAAAAWLRVRFGSIRPGILLHVLYNGGLMIAVGLAG